MQMSSLIPLSAILLFMVLLNLVHSLDNSIERRQTNAILLEVEDYPDLDDNDDDNQMDEDYDDETTSMTTMVTNAPTVTTIIIIQTVAGQAYRDVGSSSAANNGTTDPNVDNLQTEEKKDDSALKRMISIPTVVGGVVITGIIAGAIVFMRLRAKRRHAKALQQYQELSTTHLQGGTHHDGGHHSNASTTAYVSPTRNRDHPTVPSAPLEATLLPETRLPERHTISSVQQYLAPTSSSAPVPSAPSTKELEISTSIDVSRINTDSSSNYHLPHSSSPPPSTTASTAPSSPLKSPNGLDSSSSQLPSTPDIPPPAYTASAPPLFVLPSNQRRRSADQLSLDRYRR